ncbi:uncharacterized protein BO66DRAFT_24550 [Aspergillus aculeatinus CBS 121060]|uniref:Uncharacterized protein n=5 Tax=Aspergillus TaxID=5052 RepID=A0A1L9WKG7_ASPA1|nr:uncharacterized protein ASPACDRAFT_46832 [Aspergillus aculeatus ATCC 16872]XP_025506317.1 hypothetical protein BO66DRAFT_24550 [Aspergillus aculeatinus CBS 121060]XP_025529039.1 hypothetical protein BO86DRAFT_398186 [Aspergillus japonicus CBS 114.51]PYI21788.1 hypothetical protein BO99DRAFT_410454 [Aspergillus violaceofuscus CBS 115571]PYI29936.1 hypothetical protein BP00DRAFT_447930 [Aspergillus indologenus CBS 114.80]OJJ96661.1 hypothetical protein ASPACDRAFT_46832 [Aspergillus aculeatus 
MKSIAAAATLLSLLHGATASITWGTMCTGTEFTGTCTNYQSTNVNQCISFAGKDASWNDKVQSVSVWDGNVCTFWIDVGCSGSSSGALEGAFATIGQPKQWSSFACNYA